VIYDKNQFDKRRTCFWASDEFLLKFKPNHTFEYISIADFLDKKPIDFDYTDIIPSYDTFLKDKFNDLTKDKRQADYLKKKIDDYFSKNSSEATSLTKKYKVYINTVLH
jgi:hypothetical protein